MNFIRNNRLITGFKGSMFSGSWGVVLFLCVSTLLLHSCKDDDEGEGELNVSGSGEYNFTSYAPFAERPIKCFYHIPEGSQVDTPILLAIHGAGRDGQAIRNGLVAEANEKGFIVLAPQFSEDYFPGSNAFNLANIFDNGENPSSQSLRPSGEWTFQALDPLFKDFRTFSGSIVSRYDLFGHSAGAQLVHRFILFEPEALFNRIVSSAAGWYMLPDSNVNFPYGQGLSPAVDVDPAMYFDLSVWVIVGSLDTDPNSFNLRHTPEADAQGLNRVERATYFYETSMQIASDSNHAFSWQYREAPGVGHNSNSMAAFAAELLYSP